MTKQLQINHLHRKVKCNPRRKKLNQSCFGTILKVDPLGNDMTMRTSLLLFLITVFALTYSSHAQTASAQPAAQQGYLIGPGDVISIKALGEPSFDVDALTVDEDGKILIPYVETPLIAKCKTERGLQADVVKAWSKYLRRPQVYLRVAQRNSRPPVSIYGAVVQQQQVNLTRRAYLLELIAFAGVDTEKSGGMVQVFRTRPPMCGETNPSAEWVASDSGGLSVPSKVFSLSAMNQGTEKSNPEIFPGDVILVQKAKPVFVTGEVIRPGEFSIPEGGLPLTQAIAMASGISREAKTKNVRIYRKKPNSPEPEILAVNYDQIRKGTEKDVLLQPFDIVEVDKAKKSIGDILLEAVTGIPNRVPIPIRPF